jgi:hypothetical protein
MPGRRRTPENRERRNAAIAMKLKGLPWSAVANKHYAGNYGNCWQDIHEEVEELQRAIVIDAVAEVTAIVQRHDAAIAQLTEIAEAAHPLVDNGHIVRNGVPPRDRKEIEDLIERSGGEVTKDIVKMLMGEPVLDEAVNVQARKEIRAHDAERAKLLGLNKPVKVEATNKTHVTYEVVGVDPSKLD